MGVKYLNRPTVTTDLDGQVDVLGLAWLQEDNGLMRLLVGDGSVGGDIAHVPHRDKLVGGRLVHGDQHLQVVVLIPVVEHRHPHPCCILGKRGG